MTLQEIHNLEVPFTVAGVLRAHRLLEKIYRDRERGAAGEVSAQVVNAEGMVWEEASTVRPADEAELNYLRFATGVSESRAARILAEEIGYCVSIGTIDADAYPYFLEWRNQ